MKVRVGLVILGLVVIACLQQETFAGTIVSWGSMKTPYDDGLTGIAAIAAGGGHTLFLKTDGSILACGESDSGQATAPLGNDFVAIAAGGGHSLALKRNGSIVGWGDNRSGQATPPDGNDFIAIAAGGSYSQLMVFPPNEGTHSLALRKDSSIVGWGNNYDSNGNWVGQATPPDGNNFIAIAAGQWHSLALRKDGSIVGWGYNYYGEATPPDGNDFIAIAAGGEHSLALTRDGSIMGWGGNWAGQATPPDGNHFIAIAAGGGYSLALKRGEEETCNFKVAGDLNNDCLVNLYDFAAFAGDWLVDCSAVPTDPGCIPK